MKHQNWIVGALSAIAFLAPAAAANPSDLPANLPSDLPADLPSDLPADLPPAPLNLTPEVIEQSPVLQRWIEAVPNVRVDIRNDPSFVTRLQVGYSYFPSSDGTSGFAVGIEDLFIAETPLTVSADYQQTFDGDRLTYGADLHYYVLPLGGYFNLAPTVGYRAAKSDNFYDINGANLGVRLRFVPSRTSAADITLDQSWIVGDSQGLSITQINFGYAVTQDLRLSTDLEWQSTASRGDSRVGINLEWAL